jgi:DNA-cytosine methyltransferase
MKNKIKCISLFDGISGCRQALKELNIDCEYYASEIDKFAIKVAKHNHPDIIQLGDVKDIDFTKFKNVKLLSAGFPCQSYSIAGQRKGIQDERGKLIYDVFRALKDCQPEYFLLENVKGLLSIDKGNTFKNILEELNSCRYDVTWELINSSLLTAQNRQRVYILGKRKDINRKIKIDQPEDKKIYLEDIIEKGFVDRDKSYCIDANYHKGGNLKSYFEKSSRQLVFATQLGNSKSWGNAINKSGKAFTLRASQPNGIILDEKIRKLTPTECCRLQGFPDDYVSMVSNTQGYKGLGNSFTVPVIKHLIQSIIK